MGTARIGVWVVIATFSMSFVLARGNEQPRAESAAPGTPRATVIAFFQSFNDGNAKVLRDSLLTDSDDDRKVADAMAQVAGAVASARKAAAARYSIRAEDLKVQVVSADAFKSMTVKVKDDTAAMTQNGESFIVLKKVGGAWKIALNELLKKGGKTTDQTMAELQGSIQRVQQVAGDIQTGKLRTAAEAAAAVNEALPARSEKVEPSKGTTKPAHP